MAEVYSLLAHLGRTANDGLPAKATGGAMLLYAPGADEASAVRDAVALLKEAGLSVLEIEALGTLAERRAEGEEIGPDEVALMDRAADEDAVIVAQSQAFYA